MCYVGKATKIFIFIITVLVVTGLVLGFGLFRRAIQKTHKCSGDSCHQTPVVFPNLNPPNPVTDPTSPNPNLGSNPTPPPPPPPPLPDNPGGGSITPIPPSIEPPPPTPLLSPPPPVVAVAPPPAFSPPSPAIVTPGPVNS